MIPIISLLVISCCGDYAWQMATRMVMRIVLVAKTPPRVDG